MYREALWRYLRFIREMRKEKDAMKIKIQKTILYASYAAQNTVDDNETTNDDVFHDLTQRADIPLAHSNGNTGIITKNLEISSIIM